MSDKKEFTGIENLAVVSVVVAEIEQREGRKGDYDLVSAQAANSYIEGMPVTIILKDAYLGALDECDVATVKGKFRKDATLTITVDDDVEDGIGESKPAGDEIAWVSLKVETQGDAEIGTTKTGDPWAYCFVATREQVAIEKAHPSEYGVRQFKVKAFVPGKGKNAGNTDAVEALGSLKEGQIAIISGVLTYEEWNEKQYTGVKASKAVPFSKDNKGSNGNGNGNRRTNNRRQEEPDELEEIGGIPD